ncbi:hypothetical protein K3495_g5676 [Podosphaera aphanis]|nr:hypothetical protein K3495_g5676 [Podosphaera aphanis]
MPISSLLLLSQPPKDPSDKSISFAYRKSIVNVITKLKELPFASELLVAIHWPVPQIQFLSPRAELYDKAQSFLGCLYKLIYIVCIDMGLGVDTNLPGSVDARLVFIYSSHAISLDSEDESFTAGPIVQIQSLIKRQWNEIFSGDDDESKKLLAYYQGLVHQTPHILSEQIGPTGDIISLCQKYESRSPSVTRSTLVHTTVAVGGTFDHLHAGHKLLLTAAALLLQPPTNPQINLKLIVGITGDELLKNKKYLEFLKSWKQRQEDVVDFLLSVILFTHKEDSVRTVSLKSPESNCHIIRTYLDPHPITIDCIEIQDPFGPTISDGSITALVVSGETRAGGQAINQKRAEKGLSALEIFEVDVLDLKETNEGTNISERFASKISSTEIRKWKAENARHSSH